MIHATLSDFNSVWQLYVAWGISFSVFLEPNRLKIREILERINIELQSIDDAEDTAQKYRKFIHRQLSRTTKLQEELRQPIRVALGFNILLTLINFSVLSYAPTTDTEYNSDHLLFAVFLDFVLYLFIWSFCYFYKRKRMDKIGSNLRSGPQD